MEQVVTFISLCCLVFLFTVGAEPIQWLKLNLRLHDTSKHENNSKLHNFVIDLLNCSLCSGFWIGLIFYQSILLACLVSVASEILTRIIIKL